MGWGERKLSLWLLHVQTEHPYRSWRKADAPFMLWCFRELAPSIPVGYTEYQALSYINCHVIFLRVFQRQRVTKTRSYVCMNILFLGQPFCPHRSFLILLHWKNRAFIDGATKQNKKHQKRFYIIYVIEVELPGLQVFEIPGTSLTWHLPATECLPYIASTAGWFRQMYNHPVFH